MKRFVERLLKHVRWNLWIGLGVALIFCVTMIPVHAESEEVTTVTYWDLSGHAKELMAELVEHFNTTIGKEKGIIIEHTNHERKYDQIVGMAMDDGSLPDIFYQRPLLIPKLLEKDLLLPLDTLPGGKEFVAEYQQQAPFLMPGRHILHGKVYSVPDSITTLGLACNVALFIKAGIVDEAGNAKFPDTWAEVRDAAQKISQLEPGKTFGIVFPMKGATANYTYFWDWKMVKPFIGSIGHHYFDHAAGRYDFSSFAPAIEWAMQLKADGSVVPGEIAMSDDAARIKFGQEGNIGMYVSASWDVGVFNDQYPATIDWQIVPLPTLESTQANRTVAQVTNGYVISKNAAKKDLGKVMEVYKYLHSDFWETRMYEESKFIPTRHGLVEKAAKQPDKKGWKEFSELQNVIALFALPDADIAPIAGDPWYQVFQNIYEGRAELTPALADLDQRYNAAYQEAVAQGRIDVTTYQLPENNPKKDE